MRTIKIIEPTAIRGVHKEPGEIVVVDVVTADSVISAGKAVQVADGTIQNRDPVTQDRDPKPETPAEKKARLKTEAEAKAAAEKAAEDKEKAE